MSKPRNVFQDSNGDWSSSRINQFIMVIGGIALTGMALYYGRDAAEGIFWGTAGATGAVAWNSRTQEAKENIVDKAQPSPDVKASVDS